MSVLLPVFLCMLSGLQRSLADTVAVGEPAVFMCGGASETQQCILPGKRKKLHPNCSAPEQTSWAFKSYSDISIISVFIAYVKFCMGCCMTAFLFLKRKVT